MRATGPYDSADVARASTQVAGVLEGWGLRAAASRTWLQVAGAHCGGVEGEWVVEYDPDLQLVSFEVWTAERRVFGIDDLL